MSLNIRLKHSATKDKKPQVADLKAGELALNTHSASAAGYALDDTGAVQQMFGKATETQEGQAEIATQAEVTTGTDDTRIVTPRKLAAAVPAASESKAGKAEIATLAEVNTGTDNTRIVSPSKLRQVNAARDTANEAKFVEVAGDTMTGTLIAPIVKAPSTGAIQAVQLTDAALVAKVQGTAMIFTSNPTQGTTGISTGAAPSDAAFITNEGAIRAQSTASPGLILSKAYGTISTAPGSQYVTFYREGQPGPSGSIAHAGNNPAQIAYNTTSDYRLKENVQPLTGATDRLKQLKPSTFTFISDPNSNLVEGFIAHEVQDVVPGAVTGEKDYVDSEGNAQYQGVDLGRIVPLLTASLKEALTRIEALEAEVTALKG